MAGGVDALVAGGAAADLDPLDQAELLELLEGAVDAGPADRGPAAAQLVVEVERGDRAVVAGERLDHGGAGAAATVAGRLQGLQGMLGPARSGLRLHPIDPRDRHQLVSRNLGPGRARRSRRRASRAAAAKAAVATPITAVLAGSAAIQ